MLFLIFVLISSFAQAGYAEPSTVPAQGDGFAYNDHGKRDPLVPLVSSAGMVMTYDEDLSVNDLALEGIMADETGNNAAIVNGKVVRPHDQIGPYLVDNIASDHVEFLKGDEKFTIKLKKAEPSAGL